MGHLVLSCCDGREYSPELPCVYLTVVKRDEDNSRYGHFRERLLLTSMGTYTEEWEWPLRGLTPAEALLLLTSPTLWVVTNTWGTADRGEVFKLWEAEGKQVAPNPFYVGELDD